MSALRFQLFGKFGVTLGPQPVKGLEASKEQELLSYLLVHRDRPHPRETLATLLWSDTSTEKSKKYLRQALWHVQAAFDASGCASPQLFMVEHDWAQLNLAGVIWLDVAVLEQAFARTQGVAGKHLDQAGASLLKEAVELYRGDLLEGWYQDWCLFERERLQNMYLSMLDKLIGYCEEHQEFDAGQDYAMRILRHDRARERTYRQLMHLQYMAGDRTGALRQYERCVSALKEELGVKPERRTRALYENIRDAGRDAAEPIESFGSLATLEIPAVAVSLPEVLGRLKRLQLVLAAVQRRVQRDVKAVEEGLEARSKSQPSPR